MVDMSNKPNEGNNYSYFNVDQYGNQAGGGQIGMNQPGDPYVDPNNPNLMNLNQPVEDPNNLVEGLKQPSEEEIKKKEAEAKLAAELAAKLKENPIQKEFKNIFKGSDFYDNDKYRRRLMHLLFYCIIQDLLILEVLWY
jgi:hypothetical protein